MSGESFGFALVKLLVMLVDLIQEAKKRGYLDEMAAAEAGYAAAKLAKYKP
jgi:hypothetical protein